MEHLLFVIVTLLLPLPLCARFQDTLTLTPSCHGRYNPNTLTWATSSSLTGSGSSYYNGKVNFSFYVDDNGNTMLFDNVRNILTLDGHNLQETSLGSYSYTKVDSYHTNLTTWNVPLIQQVTLTTADPSWWRMESNDTKPEFFIVIKDADGNNLYTSECTINAGLPVTFNILTATNILAIDEIYMEVWEYNSVTSTTCCPYTIQLTANQPKEYKFQSEYISGKVVVCPNPALDVHWGMSMTYDYWKKKFSRNGVDNNNKRLANFLNPSATLPSLKAARFPNNSCAVSNTGYFFYGMGDHKQYGPLVCLDVIAHEYTHAVINSNTGHVLGTTGESGALNESFADIFACAVEYYTLGSTDWVMTAEAMLDGSCLRSLKNPKQSTLNVRPSPNTYKGDLWDSQSMNVHTNAGVQNYWFYLLVNGGKGTIDDHGIRQWNVNGIGFDAAMNIVHRTLIQYIKANTTYKEVRDLSLQATRDLYGAGSAEEVAVADAWYACGVGERHPSTSFQLQEGLYIIASNRQTTRDQQWYYLTAEEVQMHGGTRLVAKETGVTSVNDIDVIDVPLSHIWRVRHTANGWTLQCGNRYINYNGDDIFLGDTAMYYAKANTENMAIFAPATDFSARLALSMQSSEDYFFIAEPNSNGIYESGMPDLCFLPYRGIYQEESALGETITNTTEAQKVQKDGAVYILIPEEKGAVRTYHISGQTVH